MDDLQVVMPGDLIPVDSDHSSDHTLVLGPGLRQEGDQIVAIKAGMLKHATDRWWIESNQKRVSCFFWQ